MRKLRFLLPCSLIALALSTLTLSGCWEEQHPGTYYTFTGQTVADDLARRPEYSDFVRILQRSGMWNNLRIYGYNTCFAPNNDAIADFLKEREAFARKMGLDVTYNTVEDLPKEDCDTLAWTHLLDITCYLGDLDPGLLPKVNLNDRFLILTLDSTHVEQLGDSVVALQRRLNNAIVELQDDSCENGVVHFIDRCIDFGGDYVYDLVDKDPNTVLFSEALKLCGFHSILSEWYDMTYKIGEDSVTKGIKLTQAGNPWNVHYWDKRKTNFTLLVPTDATFSKNGINNVIPDMFDKANKVYNPDNLLPDSILNDYTNPQNPLFKFLSYHILPFLVDLSRINGRKDVMKDHSLFTFGEKQDKKYSPEDYFETYLPRSLMRITTLINENLEMDMGKVFINNRGDEGNGTVGFSGPKYRGVKILTQEEMGVDKYSALNGVYHYVDNILLYDETVREDILDRRLRIDCATISPDFITSGARQFDNSPTGDGDYSWGFKNPKNFASYHQDYVLQVRPTKKGSSYAYEGDGVDIQGQFDMYVKLPPVPHDGTWQLRLSFRSNSHCGIIQNYLASIPVGKEVERTDWKPLGIPIDLRIEPTDATVGWKDDDSDELAGDESLINALDKSMKNKGWMKGSGVQTITGGSKTHRQQNTMARIILMTDYLQSNMDHYLRIKQIMDDRNAEFLFDYMEWVPKSVYDNNEDKN